MGRILLIDRDAERASMTEHVLRPVLREIKVAHSLSGAMAALEGARFDVVIVRVEAERVRSAQEIDVTDITRMIDDGRKLGGRQDWLLMALVDQPDSMLQTMLDDAGFDDIVCEPVHPMQLASRVSTLLRLATMWRELLRRQRTARLFTANSPAASDVNLELERPGLHPGPRAHPSILAFDMTGGGRRALRVHLHHHATVSWATAEDDALGALFTSNVDACLLLASDDFDAALRFAETVRHSVSLFNLPLLIMARAMTHQQMDRAFKAGVTDVIIGDDFPQDFQYRFASHVRLERLRGTLVHAYERAANSASRDSVSGVYTHGFAMAHLDQAIADSRALNHPLTVALCRIDNMDEINRRFGYHAGDHVLGQVGVVLRQALRGEDLAARLTGREFMLIFPDTPDSRARLALGRVLSILRFSPLALPEQAQGGLHLRVSSACLGRGQEESARELLRALSSRRRVAA